MPVLGTVDKQVPYTTYSTVEVPKTVNVPVEVEAARTILVPHQVLSTKTVEVPKTVYTESTTEEAKTVKVRLRAQRTCGLRPSPFLLFLLVDSHLRARFPSASGADHRVGLGRRHDDHQALFQEG